MRNKIIDILIERDGLTHYEAEDLINETIEMMDYDIASGDYMNAEDTFQSMLGLEPDYMVGLLLEI